MFAHKLRCVILFMVCFLTFFINIGNIPNIAAQDNTREEYIIDIGDVLEINTWQEENLSREVIVRMDGRISLPLIGDVLAVGKTPMELAKSLEEKMGEILGDPSVTVLVTESKSRVYYVVGNITNPGVYPMNTPINLMQAIATAGGLSEWANKNDIIIVRPSSIKAKKDEIISFDYEKFLKGKDTSQNIQIKYGDTIIIP
jgi:polysaccharide export outer membrane protein